jgi:predicted RNA binding protein YcfA (HicA-like mRNA interferase family)
MKIRDVIRLLEQDGWRKVAQEGSHRQYKHPNKAGRVTIPGKPGDDLHPKTLASIFKQGQLRKPQ